VGDTFAFQLGVSVSVSTGEERDRPSLVVRRQNGSGLGPDETEIAVSQVAPFGLVGAMTAEAQMTFQMAVGLGSQLRAVPQRKHDVQAAHWTPFVPQFASLTAVRH
jgi:hypothetical protein